MNILITGGCGFIGVRLARTLLALGSLSLAGRPPQAIATLTLADRVPPPDDLARDPRIVYLGGDLNAQLESQQLPSASTALVFHLAAAVSGECEADFDLGLRANLDATRRLLDNCRAITSQSGTPPVLVFSSSLAVYGDTPQQPLPAELDDRTLPTPQSSYGIQKFIGEQLVADYTRKGFVEGRSVRLMTVSVRPGRPNGAASSFLSGMVREPLNGQRAICPVPAGTPVVLSSPARAIEGLLCAAQTTRTAWGPLTAMNLPGLMTTVREMAQALETVAGPAATALLDWQLDPKVEKIITSWPRQIRAERAAALGLRADTSFEQVVRDYVRENPQAITLPAQG
jgi:nucleoside-diphosphate-sugar epimerase